MPSTYLYVILTLAVTLYLKNRLQRRPPLPPGPPADPIIGHLRILPSEDKERVFYEWSKKYGGIMHFKVPGQSIIVINDVNIAIDLLDKRSGNYSDRPGFVAFDMMGWDRTITFIGYGKLFQSHRRLFQQYFSRTKCHSYRDIQLRESHKLLLHLARNSQDFDEHLERFAAGIVVDIAFGHTIMSGDDEYMQMGKDLGYAMNNCGPPGNTPVDFLPLLQYFPSWFPGTFYAYQARYFKKYIKKLHEYPFEVVQKQIADGTAKPSYLSYQLDRLYRNDTNDSEIGVRDIKGSAATIYSAGAETTWSTMSIFVLAMVLHPECQIKAQQELDSVVGSKRLPDFGDWENLPYINLILQETYRWNSAVPMGIPHCSVEDDVYNGMFIPKGSIIIPNTFGMSLDEQVYADPHKFNPDRYMPKPLGNGEPYPLAHFGFGRRGCAGKHLADASMFIGIASILSVFSIKKVIGEDGKEIIPEAAFATGFTSHPKPFKCNFQPRNDTATDLLEQLEHLNFGEMT